MYVNIKNGSHRGTVVTGIFPVLKAYNGKFVTIKCNINPPFLNTHARINVNDGDYEYCTADGEAYTAPVVAPVTDAVNGGVTGVDYEALVTTSETDADAMRRIQRTFTLLNEVTDAVAQGIVRGLIISGPPGIGKSFGVEQTMREANATKILMGQKADYIVVKGASSALGLYKVLHEYRKEGKTVIFDDCDSVLYDEVSLNLLKAALDSNKVRTLSWRTESRVLAEEDIPNEFEFEGSIIFLTNLDFDRTKASKIKNHLEAIQSRCHYLDLEVSNVRDQLLRIKQVVRDGMLREYEFANFQEDIIVNYVVNNAEHLRELSLRTVKKLADIVKMKPNDWEEFAEATLLRRDAKFKRLAEVKGLVNQ
jgi:hypothetical protein